MDLIVFLILGIFLVFKDIGVTKTKAQPVDNLEIRINTTLYKDEEAFTQLRKTILERGSIT